MKFMLLICLLFLLSCNFASDKVVIKKRISANMWAKDTLGCKQLRSKELAYLLIKKHRLMNNNEERFLKVFPSPDEEFRTQIQQVLRYYFNSKCEQGKLIPNSDMCYAEFYFRGGVLVETNFECN